MRAIGFTGFNCNLELVGQWAGEGASWQDAWSGDCGYYTQSAPRTTGPALQHPGTVVVDASDSASPVAVTYLTSPAMINPWESLKVNQKRKLLGAVNGDTGNGTGSGGPDFDVYDVGSDCRAPKLLSTTALEGTTGHEGSWAPDGLTYFGANLSNYYAIDVSDPASPEHILTWTPGSAHGLSISEDGTRGYFVTFTNTPQTSPDTNGFVIADTSEIQARRPDAQIKVISAFTWNDGTAAQHTIPVRIQGRPYLIQADEMGSGGLGGPQAWSYACAQGLPPYGFVHIVDISDESKPRLVSRVMLEVHDPANCAEVIHDTSGNVFFGYDSHYCAVDDPREATMLACGFFNSGLRVFDIRDPVRPREIAYYNPPARPGYQPGSNSNSQGECGTADWTASMPQFRLDRGEIWFTSQCNGFQIVKFTNGVWPFK